MNRLVGTNQSDSSVGDLIDDSRFHYSGETQCPASFLHSSPVQSLNKHLGGRACGLTHFLFKPQMPRCASLAERIHPDRQMLASRLIR